MRTVKTLIRLGGFSGWFESSPGAHATVLVCHEAAHLYVWRSMWPLLVSQWALFRNPISFRLSIGRVEYFEHYGTHMDAPSHFGNGRQELHEIPPERLIGPGVVINVEEKARENPNYEVSMEDLIEYEEEYGRIPPDAVVMMNSGWSRYYPDPVRHLGAINLSDVSTFNFPGFGLDACKFLLAERQVSIIGTDTNSVDPGQPSPGYGYPYPCHFHLQPNNVPLLENLANLDSIPPCGTTIFIGGIKTRGGTGGPARVLAIIDDPVDSKNVTDGADVIAKPSYILLLCLVAGKFVPESWF